MLNTGSVWLLMVPLVEILFSTISVEAIRSQATSTDVDVELVVTDANKLPSNGLELTYSAETEMWNLSNSHLGHIASGKEVSKARI